MNVRFGTKLLVSPSLTDQLAKHDLAKIVAAVNDQFPQDNVVVNVLNGGRKPNPLDKTLTDEFFRLYIQSGKEHRASEPINSGELALPDSFLAVALFIAQKVAELNGTTLDESQFAQSLAKLEMHS